MPKSEHTFRFLKGVSGDLPPLPIPGSKYVRGLNMAQLYMQGLRRVLNVLIWLNPRRHTMSFQRRCDVVRRRIEVETTSCVYRDMP